MISLELFEAEKMNFLTVISNLNNRILELENESMLQLNTIDRLKKIISEKDDQNALLNQKLLVESELKDNEKWFYQEIVENTQLTNEKF